MPSSSLERCAASSGSRYHQRVTYTPLHLPHFSVTTVDGRRVSYDEIWQQQNLLLLIVPLDASQELVRYAAALTDLAARLLPHDTVCLVTTDHVGTYHPPALVIADRWGEVRSVVEGELPALEEVEASLQHVRMACPECEGEWK